MVATMYANETHIITDIPSRKMTRKRVNCNHDFWATDPTKTHQFHDKFCGWRGTFIVGLNKGTTIAMRGAKVLDLLAGELFIKLNALLCKICKVKGKTPLTLRNMIPTKYFWKLGRVLKLNVLPHSWPKLRMVFLRSAQWQVININTECKTQRREVKTAGLLFQFIAT